MHEADGTALILGYSVVNVEAETTLRPGAPFTLTVGVDTLRDTTYRDFLDTYKGYALSPGRDVQIRLSTSF